VIHHDLGEADDPVKGNTGLNIYVNFGPRSLFCQSGEFGIEPGIVGQSLLAVHDDGIGGNAEINLGHGLTKSYAG
jgi:hypothetical protein